MGVVLQIMEIASFEKFLLDKIKVNNKTGASPVFTLVSCACAAAAGGVAI
jgi:hypothetical protein